MEEEAISSFSEDVDNEEEDDCVSAFSLPDSNCALPELHGRCWLPPILPLT